MASLHVATLTVQRELPKYIIPHVFSCSDVDYRYYQYVNRMGEKSPALLQGVNYNGAPCEETIHSLQCELVSEITRATVRGSLERRGQSQYEISYHPTIKERHQLHIKVEDQHIRGSPFPVAVKLPIEKLGTSILTIGGVVRPWGITFNQRGEVVVAELSGHGVSIFSSSEEKL